MKKAVVLFNLGGPEEQGDVEEFLFNLFFDKAIIPLPKPMRFFLAKYISKKRAAEAKEIYQKIGGGSPLRKLTEEQADALQKKLNSISEEDEFRVFVSMRYWHPMSDETVTDVKGYDPDEIILLPLYPQFSTSTSGSSIKDWKKTAKRLGLDKPTKEICCYPENDNFIQAHVDLLEPVYEKAKTKGTPRVLFSAHGLPKRVIDSGDPYRYQIEKTADNIIKKMGIENIDWSVCYQSKVGKLEWIGPATDFEIMRAAKEKTPIVIVPIAFVSEHSETLVELDILYKELANSMGLKNYFRVPALGTSEKFIESLSDLCKNVENQECGKSCEGKFERCFVKECKK